MRDELPILGTTQQCEQIPLTFPAQHQNVQPGLESVMEPKPIFDDPEYTGSGRLQGKSALITGGDSGIGRAVAVAYAKEGARVTVAYYNEHDDARYTKAYIENLGAPCHIVAGDLQDEAFCRYLVDEHVQVYGGLDILVNNAAVQFVQNSLLDISAQQLETTFRVNVFGMFYLTRAALPHLHKGSAIINTTSVTAYNGQKQLIDYSATKGAIVTFTRSLALSLVEQGIRVNAVAPGPVWTPLQPASWDETHITTFGGDTPMKRAGQPVELASTYVHLASEDASFTTGQVLHVDGGSSTAS